MRTATPVVKVAILISALVSLPLIASAQSETPETGAITLEAVAGVANYVDARRPVDLAVTITSEVLFAGNLEIQQASSLLVIPVEVPAGGLKTYGAVVPPPIGASQTRMRLFATGSDQPAVTRSLQMRVPGEVSLVAVNGPAELAASIDDATVSVTGGEVVTAVVADGQLERWSGPASYLVLFSVPEAPSAVLEWVRSGGRLVVDEAALAGLGVDLGAAVPQAGWVQYQLGAGRLIALDSVDSQSTDQWSQILQPTPMTFGPRDSWESPDAQMMGAATNAGDQRVPRLPWLLAAVVGYAVLIGPVNFLILSKMGRRELAWLTVPTLAFLAVAGFWIAGRNQLQTTLVNHATVIVGDNTPLARSAVALAVGSAGERTVQLPENWQAYPSSVNSSFGGEVPMASVAGLLREDGAFEFNIAQLGAVGLQGTWPSSQSHLPTVSIRPDGPRVEVEVENDSPVEFWAWGLVASGRIKVAPDRLPVGGQGVESVVPGNPGFSEGSVGDAVIQARQLWDDNTAWARLSGLGLTAASDLGRIESYFFGFTDQIEVPVSIDGRTYQATGTSLIVIPLPAVGSAATLTAQLVDPGEATFIESGPGYLSVATNEMTIGWSVPDGQDEDPMLTVSNAFGEVPRRLDAFDWIVGEFSPVEEGASLDLGRFRSPGGDVFVKASAGDDPFGPGQLHMSPYGFALVWDS
ncbi:MAG TPA: hypothetical protein VM470_08130 [Acidimicrobiia bacterium]|nr:hypothetical protein [Acidimicrobiia bacterium]